MKILQVSLGVKASAGGPVRSITGLTAALSTVAGCEVHFFVHNPNGIDRFDLANTVIIKGHRRDGHLDRSGDFERTLDTLHPDIVHFHGLWNVTLYRDQMACRKRTIPYILAPRGSLDAWSLKQKWLKKKLALMLFQRRAINCAAALHVTASMEAEHCRRMGYRGDFIISPNGINLPKVLPDITKSTNGKHHMLFLSRMHAKKGVVELVEAWHALKKVRPDIVAKWECELVYTKNDKTEQEYEGRVKTLIREYGLEDDFICTGSLSDDEKWRAYRRSDLFILPTHTENFGIVIAEALYAGLPVITTKNAPWDGLLVHHAGWWIELSQSELQRAMVSAMTITDEERRVMGMNGRQFVSSWYNWPDIARRMVDDYKRILSRL